MSDKKNGIPQRYWITSFMILTIVMISYLTYRDILGYFFTGVDTFPLIDAGRVSSYKDVIRILTEPMMQGTEFVGAKFYRPISSFSFSLDYAIWKLNPFGYHLTDLFLHISVSVLVFLFIRSIKSGQQAVAWLGSILFATHPILVENVPANARRQDTLAAVFLLLSLLSYLRYYKISFGKTRLLLLSVFLYGLALGAKEISIVLPLLVLAHLAVFYFENEERRVSFKAKGIQAVKIILPYFAATCLYFIWRVHILQGIGGRTAGIASISVVSQPLPQIACFYYNGLLDPYGLIGENRMTYLIAILSVLVLAVLLKRLFSRTLSRFGGKPIRAAIIFLATIGLIASVGFLAYVYVLKSSLTGQAIRQTYNAVFFSTVCLWSIYRRKKIGRFLMNPDSGKIIAFLLIWLLVTLFVYFGVGYLLWRGMYIPVIPFSIVVAIVLVRSCQSTVRKLIRCRIRVVSSQPTLLKFAISYILVFFLALGLSASLFRYSPLVERYEEWKTSGTICSIFLDKLSSFIPKLPRDARLRVIGFPHLASSALKKPHVMSISYLGSYSLKSWLDIHYPDNQMTINFPGKSLMSQSIMSLPKDLFLEMKQMGRKAVEIKVTLVK